MPAWSIPRRAASVTTTLATALTIPVNIHVPGQEDVIPEADHVEVGHAGGLGQRGEAFTAQRTGRLAPADEPGRNVRMHLVHEALGEHCRVDLTATFDQDAEDVSLAQLV